VTATSAGEADERRGGALIVSSLIVRLGSGRWCCICMGQLEKMLRRDPSRFREEECVIWISSLDGEGALWWNLSLMAFEIASFLLMFGLGFARELCYTS